jgi:hypothetical protein
MLKEELWKRSNRELCYVYEDEYGIQYFLFKVLGNKKLRVRSFNVAPHRIKFLWALIEYDLSGWKRLGDNDYIFEG